MSARRTQCDRVLAVLRDGREHSTMEFVALGILRLPSRVHDLRQRGHVIEVRRVRGRGSLYVYRLVSSRQADLAPSPDERDNLADDVESAHAQLELSDATPATTREGPAPRVNLPRPAAKPSLASEADADVEPPSLEERRRIAAEARAEFARRLAS